MGEVEGDEGRGGLKELLCMGALLNIPGRRVSRFGFEWMGNVCYALQFRMLRDGCFAGCICCDKDWKIGGAAVGSNGLRDALVLRGLPGTGNLQFRSGQ